MKTSDKLIAVIFSSIGGLAIAFGHYRLGAIASYWGLILLLMGIESQL